MALTPKQERFAQEYLVDLNATAAAERAGYKDPNIGRQLITKNNVAAAIQKAQQGRQKRTEVTQDMVIEKLAEIALGKATDFAVEGYPIVEGAKNKTSSQLKALELLGKHLGMFDGKSMSESAKDAEDDPITKSLKEAQTDGVL